jgi:hypothetical protein
MTTLKEFAEAQLTVAQKIVADGKELAPMLIVESGGGEAMVCLIAGYGDPQVKGPARVMMRAILEKHSAARYAFVMEAWLGEAPKRPDPTYLPSKDPNRLEAVVITAAAVAGEKVLLVSKIKRAGQSITFEAMGFDHQPMGPLADLFGTDTRQ